MPNAPLTRIDPNPKNVFVTAIEAGSLEAQCIRMVESLRRHGGARASDPVIAVTARFGPPLQAQTVADFNRLGVTHLTRPSHAKYAWFHYLNKILALEVAEKHVQAEQMTFLDCDTLVVREPTGLILSPDEDFTAAPSDEGVVGSTGPDCVHDLSWGRLCTLLGMSIDDLPWVTTYLENLRIRLYWNAGIYAYRTNTGFCQAYLSDCLEVLDANEGFPFNGEHSIDQVILGLTAVRLKLRWRNLDQAFNFPVTSHLPAQLASPAFERASILHYHDCLSPGYFPNFIAKLQESYPVCAEWLAPLGPVSRQSSRWSRAVSELLRVRRGMHRKKYRARVLSLYAQSK